MKLLAVLPTTLEFPHRPDLLFHLLMGFGLAFSLVAFVFLVLLCFPRAKATGDAHSQPSRGPSLPLLAMAPISLFLIGSYVWSSKLDVSAARNAGNGLEVHATGRRWAWSFEHASGPTEINALHVPVGTPVEITLTSEDVLHRLAIPELHLQGSAVPGKMGRIWLQADKAGIYPFYCTEFCGAGHASMSGALFVLDPIAYEHWVTGGKADLPPEENGKLLYEAFRCESCHLPTGSGTGPALAGRFGQSTELSSGDVQAFDADYVRESLLDPKAKVVKGYEPVMPSFTGQLDESQISDVVAYLKSLSSGGGE